MTNIDKIICINLIDRPDKYNNVKKIFEKLNLHVEFYQPEKHKDSGRIGCFESHINVIMQSYNDNLKRILIFEDDIIETSSYNKESIVKITNYLDKNAEFEYFQLGYTILPHEIIGYFNSKNLYKSNILQYNGNCTHAYILNRTGMEKIIKTWKEYCYEKELDLDIYYKIIFKNNGACSCPILFDQNFCIDGDNEVATTSYYKFLRSFSCAQYKYSFLYFLSLIRFHLVPIVIIILFFIVSVIFYKYNSKNSQTKNFIPKIRKNKKRSIQKFN